MVSIPTSYPNISLGEAINLTNELCNILYESGIEGDVVTLHTAGKQLTSLYFDCKNNRFDLSERLIELQFLEFAVKVMKRLNNLGVFKGDDVWFSSFYLYNICWNYSEVNPEFANGLVACGIETLLTSNIMHDPYIENLSKRNVNYLMKATLTITHHILRIPGNRIYFCSENLIKGLLKIASKDDKLSVLCTICLSYIACNDNIEATVDFDIFYNVKLLFYYIKIANESGGKYNSYSLFEFYEVLKSCSLSEIQKEAILKFDGFDVMVEQLKLTKDEKVKKEILLTFVNLYDEKFQLRIREIAKYYLHNKSEIISSAAKTLYWAIETFELTKINDSKKVSTKNIFINFSQFDIEIAEKIYAKLSHITNTPLLCNENNIDLLKKSYDEAAIVIVCISEAFKSSISLKIGSAYSLMNNKILFPVIVQNNYKPGGWIKTFITQASDVCYNFSNNIEENWSEFMACLQSQLKELELEETNDEPIIKIVASPCNQSFIQWLTEHNIIELKLKLGDFDMDMLHYIKKVRLEAPDFYFRSLENNMKLSLIEILKLSAALDTLN